MKLDVEYCGLKLPNPLIVAPAGITGTTQRLERCAEAGAAAAVMKSLFELEYSRRSPTPHFQLIHRGKSSWQADILYSFEQASEFGPQEYCAELQRARERVGIPVIASINCVSDEAWVEYARMVEQAGASALELNVSCPHGAFATAGAVLGDEIVRVLELVKPHVKLPLIAKLSGQDAYPPLTARRVEEAGAQAVVMFNRFTGLDLDLETERPILHGGYAGHGGPWALLFVLRWLTETWGKVGVPLSASGGVTCGEDVAKLILAGATTVQVCSAIVLQGYEVIGRLKQGLEQFMEQKGYSSLDEFRGKAVERLVPPAEVDRRLRLVAQVDQHKCIKCDLCRKVCIYDAVRQEHGAYSVSANRCVGCGLCATLCPAGAMELVLRRHRT